MKEVPDNDAEAWRGWLGIDPVDLHASLRVELRSDSLLLSVEVDVELHHEGFEMLPRPHESEFTFFEEFGHTASLTEGRSWGQQVASGECAVRGTSRLGSLP